MARFTNKDPEALTLHQAIALEKKRAAERRHNKRQAEDLAAQGRGGDTEIAHVTPGEIVLPDALQTPAVLGAIRQAAMDANIPLGRLRIGSASNSINPETGIAEFDAQLIADEPIEEITVSGSLITDDPSTNKIIAGLHPSLRYDAARFINAVKDRHGQQLRIPYGSGWRSFEEQDALYAQGRTAPGDIVTDAPGGKSYHNYGLGFDVAPLNPDGRTPNYNINLAPFAPIAKEHGLAWGGDWSKADRPHFQRNYGYNTVQLRQMMEPGARYPTIPGQRNR